MLRTLVNLCVAGFVFLLPVFVAFQIVSRGWTALGSLAARVARIVGARHVLGIGAETAITGVMLVLICILCGWLVRFSLVGAFHEVLERQLVKYIPGYETSRAAAEGKLRKPPRVLPPVSALVMLAGFWRLGYVIEQDATGNSVVFLPDSPNTDQGHVLLATASQIQIVPVSPYQLEAKLKSLGKGLLSEYNVVPIPR